MARRNDQVTKINKFIGSKLYNLRMQLKLPRGKISDVIGVSQQQISKYETGINHISVGRLVLIAKVFNKSPEFFYEGLYEHLDNDIDTDINLKQNDVNNGTNIAIAPVSKFLMQMTGKAVKKDNAKNRKPTKRLIELVSVNKHDQRSNRKSMNDGSETCKPLALECA